MTKHNLRMDSLSKYFELFMDGRFKGKIMLIFRISKIFQFFPFLSLFLVEIYLGSN